MILLIYYKFTNAFVREGIRGRMGCRCRIELTRGCSWAIKVSNEFGPLPFEDCQGATLARRFRGARGIFPAAPFPSDLGDGVPGHEGMRLSAWNTHTAGTGS